MGRYGLLCGVLCVAGVLAGCGGGGGTGAPPGTPPLQPEELTVGPFVMRPAAATSMQIESLPSALGASFAVFKGVTVDYIAVRELMDRVVFSGSRGGGWQLYTCDFFGDNLTQITFNDRSNGTPQWSPDGSMLAWTYYTATMQGEILVRPSTGGPATNITKHAADDEHPTWAPDGRWLAFHSNRTGTDRIWKTLVDGSNPTQLTFGDCVPNDVHPAWAPNSSTILFASKRGATNSIHKVKADGTGEQLVFSSGSNDDTPAWHPDGVDFAHRRWLGPGLKSEVYRNDIYDEHADLLCTGATDEKQPCWSSDGRHIFFVSDRDGGVDSIWAKQISFPHRLYRITNAAGADKEPDLGSPIPQISRVLVGPSGSDHGYDPVHNEAVAGIVAFSYRGYLNFVRLGIPPASGPSVTATPLQNTGGQLVGVVLSGQNMYYLEEDAGIGLPPIMWNFTSAPIRTAVLYLDAITGRLVTVIDMGNSVHTAAAPDPAAAVTQQRSGSSLLVQGDFRRVWDAEGELVAEGEIGAVEIDPAGNVVRAF